jgi:hypothetical protein
MLTNFAGTNYTRRGPAPKGRKDSAQGFNPGLGVLEERALKGHQTAIGVWAPRDKFTRAERTPSGATFRAHLFATDNPGLRPRAESYRPFGAPLTSLPRVQFAHASGFRYPHHCPTLTVDSFITPDRAR